MINNVVATIPPDWLLMIGVGVVWATVFETARRAARDAAIARARTHHLTACITVIAHHLGVELPKPEEQH